MDTNPFVKLDCINVFKVHGLTNLMTSDRPIEEYCAVGVIDIANEVSLSKNNKQYQ